MMKTDWKDDVLAPIMKGKRRYNIYENDDSTVSFIDATQYSQVGDNFGAAELNQIGEEINESVDMITAAVQSAQASAESAQASADKASEFTPEGYDAFVSSTELRLDGLRNFNTYADITFMDTVDESENHRTRFQIDRKSHQAYLFNHEENSDFWLGETISTYHDAPNGIDILEYVDNISIFRNSTRKLVHGFNSINSPLNNTDNDFYYDVIKCTNEWYKVIAYDVRSTNIYINEKINNVWQGWKPIRCDMIQGTLSAGATSVTITDSRITTDATYDIYASKFGISPTAVTVNNGSMILTFDKQTEPITVGVKIV